MYNTQIICTYHTPEVFLNIDTDTLLEDEKDFIRETIYRQELLNIVGMEEYNEPEMNQAIHELYIRVKACVELKNCMSKLAGQFMSTDEELGLMILFSYDYMYLAHICICELFENGKINEKSLVNLKNVIF
jgi:hypothetical protein